MQPWTARHRDRRAAERLDDPGLLRQRPRVAGRRRSRSRRRNPSSDRPVGPGHVDDPRLAPGDVAFEPGDLAAAGRGDPLGHPRRQFGRCRPIGPPKVSRPRVTLTSEPGSAERPTNRRHRRRHPSHPVTSSPPEPGECEPVTSARPSRSPRHQFTAESAVTAHVPLARSRARERRRAAPARSGPDASGAPGPARTSATGAARTQSGTTSTVTVRPRWLPSVKITPSTGGTSP